MGDCPLRPLPKDRETKRQKEMTERAMIICAAQGEEMDEMEEEAEEEEEEEKEEQREEEE